MKVWVLLILYLLLLNFIIKIFNFQNKKKIYLIIASIGIIFVMGSRSPSYPNIIDVKIYTSYFESTANIPWNKILSSYHYNFEIGYILLNKLLSLFVSWPQFLIYVESIICVSSVAYFVYRNSSKPMDSMIFFVSLGMMKFMLTGFRQSIAMCVCLWSIEFIKKKKLMPFLIMILIATSFHKTAIVFIVAYFFIDKDFDIRHIIFLSVSLIILFIFKNQFIDLGNKIFHTNYFGTVNSDFGGVGYLLVYSLIIGLALLSGKKANSNKLGINMTIISLIAFILGYTMVQVQRISWYFYFGPLIAIPNLYPKENKQIEIILRVFFISLSIFLLLHRFSGVEYNNFTFFWDN